MKPIYLSTCFLAYSSNTSSSPRTAPLRSPVRVAPNTAQSGGCNLRHFSRYVAHLSQRPRHLRELLCSTCTARDKYFIFSCTWCTISVIDLDMLQPLATVTIGTRPFINGNNQLSGSAAPRPWPAPARCETAFLQIVQRIKRLKRKISVCSAAAFTRCFSRSSGQPRRMACAAAAT